MKRNPLMPFALIATLGIVFVIVLSVWGGNIVQDRQAKKNGGGEKQEQMKPDKIFAQNCSSCHGQNLEGGAGPNLQKIGSKISKKQILDQIKNGGGGMPGNLISGDAAQKVADWLSKKK
ncbi:cytochrome c551/cytochrome c550 [Scopulibacillus darangshiensis]|uniref:Cytochrome c551/cytochrome c550 n=1 Tax=Scopulibacillus darangshiensis TaxID=442528 RepID=A0A4R2PB86_9BACL|nr:cytochrome c [Scopulibacillus darangshiensis]TCP32360.1 cytochrome c551/cytochrome c550 [Scopulibacillus darangshiensis]